MASLCAPVHEVMAVQTPGGVPVLSTVNPCGLVATSLFSDVLTYPNPRPWDETGIAWTSE